MHNPLKNNNILLLLGPVIILGALAMDIYIPFVPILKDVFQTSAFRIQATLNIFMFMIAFGQLLIGPLSDYYGAKRMLLLSIFIYAVGCISCFFTHHIDFFIIARGLQAFGACGAQVISFALVRRYAQGAHAQKLFSYLMGIVGMAPIVAPMLGTWMAAYFLNWRVIFLFLTAYALLAFLFIYCFLNEEPSPKSQHGIPSKADILHVLLDPTFARWALIPALSLSGLFLFFAMSSYYVQDFMGYSRLTYSIIFSVNAILYSLSSFIGPSLIKRFGLMTMIHFGLSTILGATCILTIQSFFAPLNLYIFLGCIYSCCISYGFIQGAGIGLALEPFKHNLGLASALIGSIQFLTATFCSMIAIHPPIESSLSFSLPMFFLAFLTYIMAFKPFSVKSDYGA